MENAYGPMRGVKPSQRLPHIKVPSKKRRCLIPADQFYEWTGPKGKKVKWAFKPADKWFCFAGVWDRAETADGEIESFALLTGPPGEIMRPFHDRQPMILEESDYEAWLRDDKAAFEMCQKSPDLNGFTVVPAIS